MALEISDLLDVVVVVVVVFVDDDNGGDDDDDDDGDDTVEVLVVLLLLVLVLVAAGVSSSFVSSLCSSCWSGVGFDFFLFFLEVFFLVLDDEDGPPPLAVLALVPVLLLPPPRKDTRRNEGVSRSRTDVEDNDTNLEDSTDPTAESNAMATTAIQGQGNCLPVVVLLLLLELMVGRSTGSGERACGVGTPCGWEHDNTGRRANYSYRYDVYR
jgi:hypothetical protein